jgi:hypothetical protein
MKEYPTRDLNIDEVTQVYGAGGWNCCCTTPASNGSTCRSCPARPIGGQWVQLPQSHPQRRTRRAAERLPPRRSIRASRLCSGAPARCRRSPARLGWLTARLAHAQYIEGQEDLWTQIDAEQLLANAEDAQVLSLQERLLAGIALYRAMGGYRPADLARR